MSAFPRSASVPTTVPAIRKARKPSKRLKPALREHNATALRRWALAGVVTMASMSAGLNGMAFGEHASNPAIGWGLGIAITACIVILGKVASNWYRHGHRAGGKLVGAIGAVVLALSVYDVAHSIAAITGEPLILATALAIGIDAGFVMCEVAATVA